jgi:hypothetical protein
MAESSERFPMIREAVASFATKAQFRDAVAKLLAAGFAPADLSVLASHESLELAGDVPGYPGRPGSSLLAGLTDEIGFIAPLTIAGFALLSGGPIAIAIAGFVGAGLGGVAIKEVLDRVTANRDAAAFEAALKAGAMLLWVGIADPQLEAPALRLLDEAGGKNVHVNERPLHEQPAAGAG